MRDVHNEDKNQATRSVRKLSSRVIRKHYAYAGKQHNAEDNINKVTAETQEIIDENNATVTNEHFEFLGNNLSDSNCIEEEELSLHNTNNDVTNWDF